MLRPLSFSTGSHCRELCREILLWRKAKMIHPQVYNRQFHSHVRELFAMLMRPNAHVVLRGLKLRQVIHLRMDLDLSLIHI